MSSTEAEPEVPDEETEDEDADADAEDEEVSDEDAVAALDAETLMLKTRAELNELAVAEGVEDPEALPNKEAVVNAIFEARVAAADDEVSVVGDTRTVLPIEEVVYDEAPVDEVTPLVRVGMWARISAGASGVPDQFLGRDVVVTQAPTRRAGQDQISSMNYEYQDDDTVFLVKPRDGGEEFECKRTAFAAFGAAGDVLGVAVAS